MTHRCDTCKKKKWRSNPNRMVCVPAPEEPPICFLTSNWKHYKELLSDKRIAELLSAV